MRTAIVVIAILFASWLTGIVSQSMFAFVTVLGSASLVATALKIDSVAKRRAKRRRLAWDAAYQHNAYMAGYDKLGTEGRYPSSAADLPAMGASVLAPPPRTAGQAWEDWYESTKHPGYSEG